MERRDVPAHSGWKQELIKDRVFRYLVRKLSPHTPTLAVLVAADSEEFYSLVEAALGPDFHVAATVSDGWAMIRAASDLSPDLIVADFEMPGLDGIEATARVSSQAHGVPVIIISTNGAPEFLEEALHAGAAGYILRNEVPWRLSEAAHAAVEQRRLP